MILILDSDSDSRGAGQTSRLGLARDGLLGALRFYCNAWLDEEKQWAVQGLAGDAGALACLEQRERSASFLWRHRPRLEQGFVAGPLHLLAILCCLLLILLTFRGKK